MSDSIVEKISSELSTIIMQYINTKNSEDFVFVDDSNATFNLDISHIVPTSNIDFIVTDDNVKLILSFFLILKMLPTINTKNFDEFVFVNDSNSFSHIIPGSTITFNVTDDNVQLIRSFYLILKMLPTINKF